MSGGNDNTYTYPVDPINMFDLSGEFGWRIKPPKPVKKTRPFAGMGRDTSDFIARSLRRQRHIVGDLHVRRGRLAIHWNGHQDRVEWDKAKGWHYNMSNGAHGSFGEGLKAYGRHLVKRGSGVISRGCGLLCAPIFPGSGIPKRRKKYDYSNLA
jgi:hypothetical protein